MKSISLKIACFALIAYCIGKASVFAGCGIDWSLPTFHFPDVNRHGILSYYEKIGEVKMGENQIPIHIHFKSDRKTSSPYAGYGWTIPILESRMVQISEYEFTMWQPEGRFRSFGRDRKNPNFLNGQGGWKAEIRGDTIKAYAKCGWNFDFKNGKIVRLGTPEGKTYRYDYQNGLVKSIREEGGSKIVLEVVTDVLKPEVTKLKIGDREIVLSQGEKPRVEIIAGQNLISGMDKSLVKISMANGNSRNISYNIAPNKVVPTFRPTKDRKIITNPVSNLIVSDSRWKYEIKKDSKTPWNNAIISRKNLDTDKYEKWHKDHVAGKETIVAQDGVTTVKSWFTSGKLTGKTRSIEQISGGNTKTLYQASYDDNGDLLRGINASGQVTTIKRNSNKRTLFKDGKPIITTSYNDDGSVQEEFFHETQAVKIFSYEEGIKKITTTFPNEQKFVQEVTNFFKQTNN